MSRHLPTSQRSDGEAGLTLVELILSLIISSVLLAGIGSLFMLSIRTSTNAQDSMESSSSAFKSSSRFANDIAAAGRVAGSTQPVGRAQTGCGGTTAVVRVVGPGETSAVTVRSYHRVTVRGLLTLERRQCSGPSIAAATTAAMTAETVIGDLDGASSSTAVSCSNDSPSPPFNDDNCTSVTLSVSTTNGLTFSLAGSISAVLAPTATTVVTPVGAPATGTCTLYASETGWGATGGAAGGTGGHVGDATLYTYNDTNQRNSFIKFDLATGTCAAPGDPWPTLPGGRLITSVKLYLTYLGKTNDSCWIFPGISYDGQVLETLDSIATWTEAGLTGSNMPSGTRNSYGFNVANQGNPTQHVSAAITDAVRQWYAPGGWKNNGFRLRRSSVGDTCGDSNKFGSRFTANVTQRPRLVITWG